jgi:WhiB family transcriptional regulator, redox-sensing transcriptional regulator
MREIEEDRVGQGSTHEWAELYVFDQEDEQDWQERALCAQTDPEAFFPEKGGSTREAKRICLGCEVRSECLEYALQHDERFGIWGGLSERERRKLKKRAV